MGCGVHDCEVHEFPFRLAMPCIYTTISLPFRIFTIDNKQLPSVILSFPCFPASLNASIRSANNQLCNQLNRYEKLIAKILYEVSPRSSIHLFGTERLSKGPNMLDRISPENSYAIFLASEACDVYK